jgi:hypothetical protein
MAMKKVTSVFLVILNFSWVNVTYGRMNAEMPIASVSQVIADVQKLFRSGCVYILQTSEEELSGKKRLTHFSISPLLYS